MVYKNFGADTEIRTLTYRVEACRAAIKHYIRMVARQGIKPCSLPCKGSVLIILLTGYKLVGAQGIEPCQIG